MRGLSEFLGEVEKPGSREKLLVHSRGDTEPNTHIPFTASCPPGRGGASFTQACPEQASPPLNPPDHPLRAGMESVHLQILTERKGFISA